MTAVDVALKRPDLVARLVLLDPAFNLKRCLTPGFLRTVAAVRVLRWLRRDRAAAECWLRYVSSYPAGKCAFEAKISEARREQLLANTDGLFADLASGGGTIDERVLGTISVPVTIVDARLSPPFLRRSSHRLKRMLPQAHNVTLEQSGHWVAWMHAMTCSRSCGCRSVTPTQSINSRVADPASTELRRLTEGWLSSRATL
jgi:pimeloyl-ACP methyl ester carboxylesterase